MTSAETLAPVLMSLLEFFGLETTDMPGILDLVLNAIETAIGLLILGILALIYLLGLIPNPFPWATSSFHLHKTAIRHHSPPASIRMRVDGFAGRLIVRTTVRQLSIIFNHGRCRNA